MFKYLGLLSLVLVVGCSSSGKKDSAATTAPTKTETPAVATAPTPAVKESAPRKEAAPSKKSKAAVAAKSTVAAEGEVTCASGQDLRKLAIKAKGEGCELEYTKAGQASSVASQIVGNAKCEEVSTKIKEKLVAAGYKCD